MIIPIKGDFIISAMATKMAQCLRNDTVDPPVIPTMYKNKIMEGAKEPYFLLSIIDMTQENGMTTSAWRVYRMKVEYHLEETDYDRHSEYRDMGERLLGILRTIDLPDKYEGDKIITRLVKANKMSFQIVENVLQFFVNYRIKVKLILPDPVKMQELEINRLEVDE